MKIESNEGNVPRIPYLGRLPRLGRERQRQQPAGVFGSTRPP